ncbi:MAG: ABC-F family ATP-binding cassette domain-containing protein [Vampirovibrionales bacterium]
MMVLQANAVSVHFGEHQVLDNVSLQITTQSRIGLVGVNGGGKSTLLKCLMGELEPNAGNVSATPYLRVQCLTQNPKLTPGLTLYEELYRVFDSYHAAKAEEEQILHALETMSPDAMEHALNRLAEVQALQMHVNEAQLEADIYRMTTGLGFERHELERPVDRFSGGWQMRINLAKVLLQGADIMLMDEPTNHLDMAACEWLEAFLRQYQGGVLVVSHDRRFLNELVTEIAELERGKLTLYAGNYSQYVEQRTLTRERQAAAAERQQKSIEEQMRFVERFRASATKSTQAKSREKQLAKIERIEAPEAELKRLNFKFPFPNPSGRNVLTLSEVSKTFGEHTLFQGANAHIEWTKEEPPRVFLLGENGAGKTTLFKMILGLEPASSGDIRIEDRVETGYYAQHQLQVLDANKTLLDTLVDVLPKSTQTEIRGILGRFLFTGEQVFNKVGLLSGGEKGRLALAKLMVTGPNLLLLDEPTNHLDTPAQEAVEAALSQYQGSILCISHDRYFIQSLATHIWELHQGRLITFAGSYDEYLEKRPALLAQAEASAKKGGKVVDLPSETVTTDKPNSKTAKTWAKQQKKELQTLEKQLSQLSQDKQSLLELMATPEVAQDYARLQALTQQLEHLEASLKTTEEAWLILHEG